MSAEELVVAPGRNLHSQRASGQKWATWGRGRKKKHEATWRSNWNSRMECPFNSEKKSHYLWVHIIWVVPPKALALISTTFFSYSFPLCTPLHLSVASSPFLFCFKAFSQAVLPAIHRTPSLTYFKPMLKVQCISQLSPTTNFSSWKQPQFAIDHDDVGWLV